MTVHPQEISRLKAALEKSARGVSRAELAAFAAKLKDVPLAKLRKQLDERVIGRKWKRDLAEAEIVQRSAAESGGDGDKTNDGSGITGRKSAIAVWGRWVAAILIAGCTTIIGYTAFLVWTM